MEKMEKYFNLKKFLKSMLHWMSIFYFYTMYIQCPWAPKTIEKLKKIFPKKPKNVGQTFNIS